tara:strand:+ start:13067 stop:13360 length:294 start_codon:yes stop_codon:yes gene_type:complete
MAAEKRGNTVKLDYDFNTAGVLEVNIKDDWYRVTSKDFRSFDGPRRITEPINQPGQGIKSYNDIKYKTYEYSGPVYMHGTNYLVTPTNKQTVIRPKL